MDGEIFPASTNIEDNNSLLTNLGYTGSKFDDGSQVSTSTTDTSTNVSGKVSTGSRYIVHGGYNKGLLRIIAIGEAS